MLQTFLIYYSKIIKPTYKFDLLFLHYGPTFFDLLFKGSLCRPIM